MMKPGDEIDRGCLAYHEGANAFYAGEDELRCPYHRGCNRVSWYAGFIDARTKERVGDAIKRLHQLPGFGQR